MKATSSLSAELLLCNFLSCFALKSRLLQDFQNALPLLATSRRQSLQYFAIMAVAAMCSAVAPVLKGFTASEKAAAHYWQCFEHVCNPFLQLGNIKISSLLQSGPCQKNPLRKGSPHKKQGFPENESNQFLISRALVVQFPLLLCPKESAVARFSKRIASAGHFSSPKSPKA